MENEESGEEKEKMLLEGVRNGEFLDRGQLLTILKNVIKKQELKTTNGRIRDIKNEKIRLESVRVLGYLCYVANNVLKDRSLDKIEERLEALENASK